MPAVVVNLQLRERGQETYVWKRRQQHAKQHQESMWWWQMHGNNHVVKD